MTKKGKSSEVGEKAPTNKSQVDVGNLVDNVLGARSERQSESGRGESENEKVQTSEQLLGQDKQNTDQVTEQNSTENSEESEEGLSQNEAEEEGQQTEAETEEDGSSESEKESAGEEEDDLIPASKHKKILDKLNRRIDSLTQQIKSKESTSGKENSVEDKLDNLSVKELEELGENTDEALLDAKVSQRVDDVDQSKTIQEYRQLKKSIKTRIQNYPQRFQQKQIKHLDSMIEEAKEVDPEIEGKRGKLWNLANQVFTSYPSLRNSETGMAEALAMATQYYLGAQKVSAGTERATKLSKKVNTLKKKTSLEGKTRKASADQSTKKKLRENAVRGTYEDKKEFVKSLLPDDFV